MDQVWKGLSNLDPRDPGGFYKKKKNALKTVNRFFFFFFRNWFWDVFLVILQNSEEFKKQPLLSINKDVDYAAREMQTVNKDQIQCLKELAKCHELINWIRTEIKGKVVSTHLVNIPNSKN